MKLTHLLSAMLLLFLQTAIAQEKMECTDAVLSAEVPFVLKICEAENDPQKFTQEKLEFVFSENFIIPQEVEKNKISRTVGVSFLVEKNGSISHFRYDGNVDNGIQNAIENVLVLIPEFEPAKTNGEPVCMFLDMKIEIDPYFAPFAEKSNPERMPVFISPNCPEAKLSYEEMKPCSDIAMLEMVYSTLQYPVEARNNGIAGMPVVSFVITKEGKLDETSIKVTRSLGYGIDEEMIRVAKLLRNWIPGVNANGDPVNVQFNLPIRFKLE